jgi:thiosulfate reductase cytochrome b subunit
MKKIYLHPLPVRIWHWLNVVSFLVLIATGLQIRYRDAIYLTSFKTAVDIHNIFGFVLLGDFILWALYYLATRKLKIYIPDPNVKSFIEGSVIQGRYYLLGIFNGDKNPHSPTPDNKFNPLQQLGYFNIMLFLIPLQILTGFMLWDLKWFAGLIAFAGGVKIVDSVHMFLFLFLTAFLFVHVYLSTLGHTPLAHIKAMITGYEEEPEHGH